MVIQNIFFEEGPHVHFTQLNSGMLSVHIDDKNNIISLMLEPVQFHLIADLFHAKSVTMKIPEQNDEGE